MKTIVAAFGSFSEARSESVVFACGQRRHDGFVVLLELQARMFEALARIGPF